MTSFFTSVEFYIIMTVIAAAIVAFAARPRQRGSMQEYLLASQLFAQASDNAIAEPHIEFQCLENNVVRLYRRVLDDVDMSGAVSAAISFNGVDLVIEERIVPGWRNAGAAREAVFELDFLRAGWYEVRYNSEPTGRFVAFRLHVRPGLVAIRKLQR